MEPPPPRFGLPWVHPPSQTHTYTHMYAHMQHTHAHTQTQTHTCVHANAQTHTPHTHRTRRPTQINSQPVDIKEILISGNAQTNAAFLARELAGVRRATTVAEAAALSQQVRMTTMMTPK